MPVIQISTFEIDDQKKAEELLQAVTEATHRVLGVPLDKVSAYLVEVPARRWADAGVTGNDPDFPTLSRRKSYEEGCDR